MDEVYFSYNGKTSIEMGLRIHSDTILTVPERDVEFIEIPGRDGELAIDKERLKGFDRPIPVSLFVPEGKTIEMAVTEISEWLRSDVAWKPLMFSWYEGFVFEAMCYSNFDIKATLRTFGKTVISFKFKPYKYTADGNKVVQFQNGMVIHNPTKRPAKPLIHIEGTGNITLINNGLDWLILTSVDGSITVDSKMMSVYKGTSNQFEKMNANLKPLFPLFSSGANKVTWTGNVSKVEITPKWEAIV